MKLGASLSRTLACLLPALALVVVLGTACGGGGGTDDPDPGPPDNPNLLGAELPSRAEVESAPQPLLFGATGAPNSVDLSTDHALPPVGDQGQRSSCVAWAVGYGMGSFEVAKASTGGGAGAPGAQASPGDLYAKILRTDGQPCVNGVDPGGTNPETAMRLLVTQGVKSLAEYPYTYSCSVPSASGPFAIKGYHMIRPEETEAIKTYLAQGHPIPFGAMLFSDFQQWGGGPNRTGVYHGNGQLTNGGHMMLIVGFDDGRQAWRVMNSWGTGWGDNGFFWMSYSAFANSARMAYVADGGGANVVNPPDPSGGVTFSSFAAIQYLDYQRYIAYLVMPFQLSEAFYVKRLRMIYEETGESTPWATIEQWTWANYVWLARQDGYVWASGRWSVEFQGTTRSGVNKTIKATAPLTAGNAPSTVHSSLTRQPVPPGAATRGARTSGSMSKGMTVYINGQPTRIK